ncbi:MAG TPA: CHAT domain-containing protein, partial [Herpetosiphonaceae bacterium]
RPDQPLFSWIGLDDARLTVAEMYSLALPADSLVVLSACQTGRGTPSGGGLLGMARGLLSAGAAALLVSQWRLADQPAAELMGWLYDGLLGDGLAPAAALQAAQRQAIAAGLPPGDWAGYMCVEGGNGGG